jgi:mono/diheme cytochrome c family protein
MVVTATLKRVLVTASAAVPLLFAPALLAQKGDATKGAVTYGRQCAGCHGKEGAGDTAMGKRFQLRDLRSTEVQHQTDAQLFDIIAKGKKGAHGSMPGYETSLGHDGIHDVIAFIRQAKSK